MQSAIFLLVSLSTYTYLICNDLKLNLQSLQACESSCVAGWLTAVHLPSLFSLFKIRDRRCLSFCFWQDMWGFWSFLVNQRSLTFGIFEQPLIHTGLAGLFFVIDMMLGFHTGYVISYNLRKRVVMDGKQVAKWYTLRGSFFVDLLSSIAWVTQVTCCIKEHPLHLGLCILEVSSTDHPSTMSLTYLSNGQGCLRGCHSHSAF